MGLNIGHTICMLEKEELFRAAGVYIKNILPLYNCDKVLGGLVVGT